MKYVLELSDKFMDENGNVLYKAKGFNSLVFDDTGITKLEKFDDIVTNYTITARSDGYNVGVYEYNRLIEYIINHPVEFKTFLTGIDIDCTDATTPIEIIRLINDHNAIFIVSKFNEWIKEHAEELPDTDIKIGDVVINTRTGSMVLIIAINEDGYYCTTIDSNLNKYLCPKDNLVKTGKNCANEISTIISVLKKD